MIYGYGIVDKDGSAWIGDGCVSEDRYTMELAVEELNEEPDDRTPYSVTLLMFEEYS